MGVNRVESAAKESERSGRRKWKYAEDGMEVVDGGTMTDVAMYVPTTSVCGLWHNVTSSE